MFRSLSLGILVHLFCLVCPLNALATNWYVDNAAAGASDGSSWPNAWKTFASIQWTRIQPGDTLFISGGSTEKIYRESLTVGKSGISGAPITIKVDGSNSAHSGKVIFDSVPVYLANYVTFTGNVNGARKIEIRNFFDPDPARGIYATAIMALSSTGVVIDSIMATNVNNVVNIQDSSSFIIRNGFFRQVRGDAAIRSPSSGGTGYDSNLIENNDIELAISNLPAQHPSYPGFGPDGIQGGTMTTIRGNIFRVKKYAILNAQHTDYLQSPASYMKVYNNEFLDIGDSGISIAPWNDGARLENIWIYNNIFRIVNDVDPYPEYIRCYNGAGTISTIKNLKIFNNLFVDNPTRNNVALWYTGDGRKTATILSGNEFRNNIFYNSGAGNAWDIAHSTQYDSGQPCSVDSSGCWRFDNNIYFHDAGGSTSVRYGGVGYSAAQWVSAREPGGSTSKPIFQSYTLRGLDNNYRLQQSDTVARDKGANFSAYFTSDRDGTFRPQGNAWDIGPYEFKIGGDGQSPHPPENFRLNTSN